MLTYLYDYYYCYRHITSMVTDYYDYPVDNIYLTEYENICPKCKYGIIYTYLHTKQEYNCSECDYSSENDQYIEILK